MCYLSSRTVPYSIRRVQKTSNHIKFRVMFLESKQQIHSRVSLYCHQRQYQMEKKKKKRLYQIKRTHYLQRLSANVLIVPKGDRRQQNIIFKKLRKKVTVHLDFYTLLSYHCRIRVRTKKKLPLTDSC